MNVPKKENVLSSQIVHVSTSLQQDQLWKNGNCLQVDWKCPEDLRQNYIKT